MNRNAVGTFSNMMENVATENDLPDTTGHIFNIDGSIVRINKKRASVTTGKGSKSVRVLASGEKCESIRVIACCDAAIQFLPPVLVAYVRASTRNKSSVMTYIQGHLRTRTSKLLVFAPIIQPVVHRLFHQIQSFRKGHSTF